MKLYELSRVESSRVYTSIANLLIKPNFVFMISPFIK
jgi:hypothetical protein